MPKDYANKNINRGNNPPQGRRFLALGGAIFAVVFFIGAIAYGIHVYHQIVFFSKEHVNSWFGHEKTELSSKDKIIKKLNPPNDEIEFDFYRELPKMQVNLPASAEMQPSSTFIFPGKNNTSANDNLAGKIDESIKSVMAQHSVTSQKVVTQFILQLGEFKDQLNASQLRLSLLLAGIETEILKTPEHTYRVQKGPYANERQAKSAQRQLSKKGFEGSIKKL